MICIDCDWEKVFAKQSLAFLSDFSLPFLPCHFKYSVELSTLLSVIATSLLLCCVELKEQSTDLMSAVFKFVLRCSEEEIVKCQAKE